MYDSTLAVCLCFSVGAFTTSSVTKMSSEIVNFVQLIENRACLYNNNLQEYSNKNITERAWSEIAQQINWSVAECKEKWRNIRNGFVRSLKPPPSGSSSKIKKKYYLHEVMQFVLPYVKPVQHAEQTGNITLSDWDVHHAEEVTTMEDGHESDITFETAQNTSTSTGQKRKRKKGSAGNDEVEEAVLGYITNRNAKKTEDDSRKLFLLSLLPDVNSLSAARFRQFKIRSLLLVEDLLKNENEEFILPNQASPFVATPTPSPSDAPTPSRIIYAEMAHDFISDDSHAPTFASTPATSPDIAPTPPVVALTTIAESFPVMTQGGTQTFFFRKQ
ncbi:uncharacterized protein LOC118756887 [Rhagoletis pomonella]|uniref:uncharacterized protein LOC118756887 n=1 Tax=Rhagoletis pomonella TaxID=28610 RepID=UPI001781EBAE|nr:uncharacterized protein LOC118756887 [Rhagoletis pomonella]